MAGPDLGAAAEIGYRPNWHFGRLDFIRRNFAPGFISEPLRPSR